MSSPVVIKVSGHHIDDANYLTSLAQTIAKIESPVILIHGGGKEITEMQQKLGIQPVYTDGIRITDEVSLAVVTMVLCGTVNKRIVRHFLANGVDAIGISALDRGIVRAKKMPHPEFNMGFTGEVSQVNAKPLLELLAQGVTPIISPVCLGKDSLLNVNGDHVAAAIASAINAEKIIFLSNVNGVLVENEVISELNAEQVRMLIDDGTIHGGMIPKVEMALHVLKTGIPSAMITDLEGLKTSSGTLFLQS